jgi:hypothetical protein
VKKYLTMFIVFIICAGFLSADEKPGKFSGYTQFQLYTGVNSGIDIPNAVLKYDAKISKDVDFKLEANLVPFANGGQGNALQQVSINWHPDEKFNISLGKIPNWLSQAKLPDEWESIEYPITLSLAPFYKVGFEVNGKLFKSFLEYRVGIFNSSENLADFSDNMEFSWILKLWPTSWLSVGVGSQSNQGYYEFIPNKPMSGDFSFSYGLDNELPTRILYNGQLFEGFEPQEGRSYFGSHRVSAHLSAEGEAIKGLKSFFLLEYMSEELGNEVGRGGLYLLFTQFVTKKLQFVFVSENYDCGLERKDVYTSNAVGFNYFLEKNIKFQASYVCVHNLADRFLAQVQVSF